MVIQKLTPDKQEIIEMLLNDGTVTMEEASRLAEVSVEEIEEAYGSEDEEEDDDPQCVCGTYLSEHSMLGCPEGFQTPLNWEKEREAIRERAFRGEDSHLDDYGDYGEYGCDY